MRLSLTSIYASKPHVYRPLLLGLHYSASLARRTMRVSHNACAYTLGVC